MLTKTKKFTFINWSIFAIFYLFFLWWHGSFERPLSPEEIDHYVGKLSEKSANGDTSLLRELLSKDNGKPIFMVNAIKLRDTPNQINGNMPGNNSELVLKEYSNFVIGFLIKRGSYPIYAGTASGKAASTWGIDNAEEWSSAAIVRYRSLRTLLDLATSSEFKDFHEYKIAAIEKTIAYPTFINFQPGGLALFVFFILLSMALAIQLLIVTRLKRRL